MAETRLDEISLDRIRVSRWNVRTLDKDKGIEELAKSIKEFGLLQPVVVFEVDGEYELIVGQRRFLAYKELRKEDRAKYGKIAAMILGKGINEERTKIFSLSENIHRVELNRADIISVVSYLFAEHRKSAKEVARLLGKSVSYVYEHLRIQDAPDKLIHLLAEKKIRKEDVKRVMEMAPGDENKMIELAHEMTALVKPEKMRLKEIAKQKPHAGVPELIAEAKRPKIEEKVIIPLTPPLMIALDKAAKQIGLSREDVAKQALQEWLDNKGFYKG